ncbi:hypothetical protein MMC21_006778 [Puttea exsequens]|nr:hypothetical protein [Puttea exsequens]
MNTIRSTWIGWGSLIIAGGGSYYFAKRQINRDRAARHEEVLKRQRIQSSVSAEYNSRLPSPKHNSKKTHNHASSPSTEASSDPAPSEHSLEKGGKTSEDGSPYLATKPFKSKKGDRFS